MYDRELDLVTYAHSNARHWAMRTVRHGRVKIGGQWFYPDPRYLAYDGRLDGQRFLFGRYPTSRGYEPFVELWGPEALARADEATYAELWGKGAEVVDGTLPWSWWYTAGELQRRATA